MAELLPRPLVCTACGRAAWIDAPPDRSRRNRAALEMERQRWAQYDASYADMK